ncbi:MAG: hypothetical protein OXI25_00025 [Chloroflexota bacterium]|nr:hypothetical protein [Chloroflexota bacterium]
MLPLSLFSAPQPQREDPWALSLRTMGEAATRLEGQLETFHAGRVGVVVRPDSAQSPESARAQLEELLRSTSATSWLRFDVADDDMEMQWLLVRGDALKGLARDAEVVCRVLEEAALGPRIIAAVFPFTWQQSRQYWILQRRLNRYTPFAPVGPPADQQRDHALESRMEKALRKQLPTEKKAQEWYPIWGMPL